MYTIFGTKPRSPDFICIGAQKAATTWLDACLRAHSDIWLPPIKEVHFFDRYLKQDHPSKKGRRNRFADQMRAQLEETLKTGTDENFNKIRLKLLLTQLKVDPHWYGSIFAGAPTAKVAGEMTPSYAVLPDAGLALMKELAPDAKFIFSMRDPIERAWSQVRMLSDMPGLTEKGRARQMRDFDDIVARSDYVTTIRRYNEVFPNNPFLALSYEDVTEKPEETVRAMFDFLGVDQPDVVWLPPARNVGKPKSIPEEQYARLKEAMTPVYRSLMEAMPDKAAPWVAKHDLAL